ncbi:hypothetical protein GCM10022213_20800 [Parerythrobacter jejuensis]
MRSAARIFAFILPIAGLAAIWGWTDYKGRQGNDWLVPIAGYDPRDLLRGHYIDFTYDWPGLEDLDDRYPLALCLEGASPVLERVTAPVPGADCPYPVKADLSSIYGQGSLERGRFYVPQTQAKETERKLFDNDLQGYVRIRQREDGHITPLELVFEPITDAQRARRDAPVEEAPPPPPVPIQKS